MSADCKLDIHLHVLGFEISVISVWIENFDRLEGGGANMGAGKYFDNLVAMIEGSMRGLEL